MSSTRILLVLVLVALVRRLVRRASRGGHGPTELRYRVPEGQDPAAVLATLRVNGFAARSTTSEGAPIVVISLPAPAGRERAREILRAAPVNTEGDPSGETDIAFTDEDGTGHEGGTGD